MNVYTGKTVLITGSRGIGESIVKNMFSKGANVIIVSPSESSETLAASLDSSNNKAVAIRSDLSSSTSATELAVKAVQASKGFGTGGNIDFLVLCGAIAPFKSLEQVDEATWNRTFAVNVLGPLFLIKALAPSLVNDGRIILFSSSGTFSSQILPIYLPYMASKGALEQAARALSKDPLLVTRGISTTVISPGVIATDMLLSHRNEEQLDAHRRVNPYGRLGEPSDIVMVVDSAIAGGKWLNGTNIRVSGGSAV